MTIKIRAALKCDRCGVVTVGAFASVELSSKGLSVGVEELPDGWECEEDRYYGGEDHVCPGCVEKKGP